MELIPVAALREIADMTFDPWTNGAKAGEIARAALASIAAEPLSTDTHQSPRNTQLSDEELKSIFLSVQPDAVRLPWGWLETARKIERAIAGAYDLQQEREKQLPL